MHTITSNSLRISSNSLPSLIVVYVFIGEHVALVHLVRAMASKGLFDNGEYVVISIDDKLNLPNFFDIGK
jgi:hypothetical protein